MPCVLILTHGELVKVLPNEPPFRVIDLGALPVPDCVPNQQWLSDYIFFLTNIMLEVDGDYIWLCNGRHDTKWGEGGWHQCIRKTKIADLPSLTPAHENQLLCLRAEFEKIWWKPLGPEEYYPGMPELLMELREVIKLGDGATCFTTTFCIHRKHVPEVLRLYRAAFSYFQGRYGIDLPFVVPEPDPTGRVNSQLRKGSFFYERVLMMVLGHLNLDVVEVS